VGVVGEPLTVGAAGDMNGDGTFERDTGKDPTTAEVFTNTRQVTVTVRVIDDDGKFTDDTVVMKPRRTR